MVSLCSRAHAPELSAGRAIKADADAMGEEAFICGAIVFSKRCVEGDWFGRVSVGYRIDVITRAARDGGRLILPVVLATGVKNRPR